MTRIVFLFVCLILSPVAMAQPYCAMYSDGTRTCGIPTLYECDQSISGVGGSCAVDDTAQLNPPIEGPIQQWLEQRDADDRPRSPALDQVPPPPLN